MQQRPLAMDAAWPTRIGPEQERVFDQCDRSAQLYRRMACKELMGINEREIQQRSERKVAGATQDT